MKATYLMIHGWGGSDHPHWQFWLTQELRAAGYSVEFPDLPDRDFPEKNAWIRALHESVSRCKVSGSPITVICHSLGVTAWLHYLKENPGTKVERTLLVAPPGLLQFARCNSEVKGFVPIPLSPDLLLASSTVMARLVCTENDPFCEEGALDLYGHPLNIPVDLLPPSAGHINVNGGYGPWPELLAWCRGEYVNV
jgi:predicted alpha/beta hydrolase family esterase